MPVIYIKKKYYDALIMREEKPKIVIEKLLIEYLKEEVVEVQLELSDPVQEPVTGSDPP